MQAKEKGGDDGKTDVVMKFRPSSGCLDRPALAEYIQEGGASIRVPLSLSSPDQVLPVEFELVARLTQGDLTWEPAAVDFGKCFTSQVCIPPLLSCYIVTSLACLSPFDDCDDVGLLCAGCSCAPTHVLCPLRSPPKSLSR